MIKAGIEGDEIVVRVPISALETALQWSDYGQRCEHTYGGPLKVNNTLGFAHDVVGAMTNEEEDGSTLITKMVDKAMEEASEQGSEYLDDPEEAQEIDD